MIHPQNTLWKKENWTPKVQHNTPSSSDSVLLYVDEKGSVTATKTHGGTSWSSVQVKIEKAQKIKRLLNVFGGVYDLTNDKIHMYNAIKGRQGRNSLSIFLKKE